LTALPRLRDRPAVRFLVGTSGYSYPQWRGRFYPEELASDGMLAFYGARLATVEINNTFYRMPRTEVLATWAAQVPDGFTFVLKASQRISHQAKLKPPEAHDSMAYLWKVAAALGGKLGPVLIQTSPYLRKDLGRLREFAAATIAPHQRVAMELQHPSWEGEDVDTALADCGIARCIADKDDGSARAVRTAAWTYTRLRKEDYSDDELRAWRDRLAALGGDEHLVFFKHEDTARGAEMAIAMANLTADPAQAPTTSAL
jgi:uncharacterized protein YecE (DUF72 family)